MSKVKTWLAVALALCIVCASGFGAKPAAAAGKTIATSLDDLVSAWYYVPSTIPEEFRCTRGMSAIIRLYAEGDRGSRDNITKASIKFISGDETLKDAVTVEMMSGQGAHLRINADAMTRPGQAVFRFTFKSAKYSFDEERTLTVYNWADHPLLEEKEAEPKLTVQPGQTVTSEELFDAALICHQDEIAAATREERGNAGHEAEARIHCEGDLLNGRQENQRDWTVTPEDYGEYTCTARYDFGNVSATRRVRLVAGGYRISGPTTAGPGEQTSYELKGITEGESFTWSAEGEGASIDPKSGTLTVDAAAPFGTKLTVTATPDTGEAVSLDVTVYSGVMEKLAFKEDMLEGFVIPVAKNDEWRYTVYQGVGITGVDDNTLAIAVVVTQDLKRKWIRNPEDAADEFMDPRKITGEKLPDIESRDLTVDGYPVRTYTYAIHDKGQFSRYVGMLQYPRGNSILIYTFQSNRSPGGTAENTPRVTLEDMEYLAGFIRYDESQAELTIADAALTISEKNGQHVVSAGKKLTLSTAFASPEKINRKAKNDGVVWRVEGPEEVTIKKGVLSVGKKLAEPAEVTVTAESEVFGTTAEYRVTVLPAVKAITAEPAEIILAAGAEQTVTVKPDPENVPPLGLTWAADKKGIVEITDHGDGTATIQGLAAGKTTVTMTEPGGKKVNIKLTVEAE